MPKKPEMTSPEDLTRLLESIPEDELDSKLTSWIGGESLESFAIGKAVIDLFGGNISSRRLKSLWDLSEISKLRGTHFHPALIKENLQYKSPANLRKALNSTKSKLGHLRDAFFYVSKISTKPVIYSIVSDAFNQIPSNCGRGVHNLMFSV